MNITEKVPTVVEDKETEALILIVAKMLFKAKYPLRRWAHTKGHAQKDWIEKAEKAYRLMLKDERHSVETARIY